MLKDIVTLIKKDLLLEWRQKYALGGMALYLASTVFVCYLVFDGMIGLRSWNALYWLIMLFAAINAILKGFVQENERLRLFYYCLVSPRAVIWAKIIYHVIIMVFLGLGGYLIFSVFMGNPMGSPLVFLSIALAGMVGFASVLTLVSAIAAGARNHFTLMAVMGFPLILPLLLSLVNASAVAMEGGSFVSVLPAMMVVVLIIVLSLLLSNLLFPYIWKE